MTQEQIYNLVEAAKHGDDNAFAQLYEESYRMVYHVCLGYLKNNEDAEDLTQEVFLKAYNSIRNLNDNLTFFGWLQTMAANRSKNKLRDRKEFVSYEDSNEIERELTGDDNLQFLPDTYILEQEQCKVLDNIMREELSDVQYQTIYSYYYNNLSVEQISIIMSVPIGTVKTRLKNSRIRIKEGVERYERVNKEKISICGAIPALGLVIGFAINSTSVNYVPFAAGTAAATTVSSSLITKIILGTIALGTIGVGTVAVVNHFQNSRIVDEQIAQTAIITTEDTYETEPSVPNASRSDEVTPSRYTAAGLILSSELNNVVTTLRSNAASFNYDSIASNNPGVMNYLNENAYAYDAPGDAIIVIASDYNGDGVNELFICGLTPSLEDYQLLEMYTMTSEGAVRVCPADTDYEISYYYFTGIGVVSQDDSSIVDVLKLSPDCSSLIVDSSYNSFDELNINGTSIPGAACSLRDYQ